MDNTPPSELLEQQHRQIDGGIEAVANGNGNQAALAESLRLLYLHVYVEEAFLFPPLEELGITMPVFVMRKEHGEMWPFMQTLDEAVAAEAPLDSVQQTALSLFRLLQVHNPKEEEVVYTAADRLVAEDPEQPWLTALTTQEIPSGWTCAMAGSAIAASPFQL